MTMAKKKIYGKEKIAITIDSQLLKKLEKIKEYPRWKGNRSEVIEEAVEQFIEDSTKQEVKCLICSCTDSNACADGCSWIIVDRKKGLGICSNCVPKGVNNAKTNK